MASLIGDFGAELYLEKLQHRQQQMAQIHVKLIQAVQRFQRHAGQKEIRVIGAAQMFAIGRQTVIVDGREDIACPRFVVDDQTVDVRQAGKLLAVTACRLDGMVTLAPCIHMGKLLSTKQAHRGRWALARAGDAEHITPV